jgi:hypothetical protein
LDLIFILVESAISERSESAIKQIGFLVESELSATLLTMGSRGDQNGKASISSLTAQLGQPSSSQLASACPNGKWTATATTPHITSATLIVTFNGQTIYQQTFPA